jgi:hypothetical protein
MYWKIYILYSIIVIYIIALIAAKVHSPFWFHQPVFHTYELFHHFRWNKSPYWKRTRPPKLGIYCDIQHIHTWATVDISTENWSYICSLLQGYYMDNNAILFLCAPAYLQKVLFGNSYLSCFREKQYIQPSQISSSSSSVANWTEKWMESPYGCITSRPIVIHFSQFPEKTVHIHHWDFICVDSSYYKHKNLSRNLIQTHIYNHSQSEKTFSGGYTFIKHGSRCNGVVPLVQYDIFTFILRDTPFHKLPRNYSIRCLNHTHVDIWKTIYLQITQQYEIALLPDLAITIDWLKNERYFIYITIYRIQKIEHIHGVYIFENAHMVWDDDTLAKNGIIRLVASMCFGPRPNHDPFDVLFFRGFINCLQEFLLLESSNNYGILEIPTVSDNSTILNKWKEKYELRNQSSSAYYLYNLVYPKSPISPHLFISVI